MLRSITALTFALLLPLGSAAAPTITDGPTYTADGAMNLPANYREWVFLTSGLDISYNTTDAAPGGHSVFQNVFVNPSAYKAFLATGTWPDKTVLVLEIRGAAPKASIDKRGQTQTEVHGLEVHVKDEAKIPGKWGFYSFDDSKTSKLIDHSASCYSCHEAHAAVDTTFVQFYPTLLPISTEKKTLSAWYLQDQSLAPGQVRGSN
jgi:hypothetical protein